MTGPRREDFLPYCNCSDEGKRQTVLDECKANAENFKAPGNTSVYSAVRTPWTSYMECICNYPSCQYDQGGVKTKAPCSGRLTAFNRLGQGVLLGLGYSSTQEQCVLKASRCC